MDGLVSLVVKDKIFHHTAENYQSRNQSSLCGISQNHHDFAPFVLFLAKTSLCLHSGYGAALPLFLKKYSVHTFLLLKLLKIIKVPENSRRNIQSLPHSYLFSDLLMAPLFRTHS